MDTETKTDPFPFRSQKPPLDTTEVRRRPKDEINDVVLCTRLAEDGCGLEYITWTHNKKCGGYAHGHYAQTEEKNDFETR